VTDWPLSFTQLYARKLHAGTVTQARRPRGLLDSARPGDRLWVREPFRLATRFDAFAPTQALLAGDKFVAFVADDDQPDGAGRQRFAREMPRSIHRAHLVIVSNVPARLQELDDHDAIACGFLNRAAFARNWDAVLKGGKFSISGTKIRWSDNPAVNVISFKLVRSPLS